MPLQVECLEPQAALRIGAELAGRPLAAQQVSSLST